jgi:apolipoprotein N-acyltransferase
MMILNLKAMKFVGTDISLVALALMNIAEFIGNELKTILILFLNILLFLIIKKYRNRLKQLFYTMVILLEVIF